MEAFVTSAYTHPVARAVPQAVRQLVWFALVCVVAFCVPYLGISVLGVQHDLFYLACASSPPFRVLEGQRFDQAVDVEHGDGERRVVDQAEWVDAGDR